MNKTGWIIYNGNLPGNKFFDFAQMLQEAATRKNSHTKIYKNTELLALLDSDQLQILNQLPNALPDYVLFTDKDLYLAKQFELLGVPVFNSARAIEISDDKIATYQRLAYSQLPIPKTIIAPKIFIRNTNYPSFPDLETVINTLGIPMIVKEAFGSFGEQVYLIRTLEELRNKIDELQGKPFMFQEFIKSSFGKDIRIQVVGNQVVAAMKRQAIDDFRANVTAGGTMEAYEPSEPEKKLAIQATKSIQADFAGVDLLFGPNEQPLVCEINSNAHIRNLLECTGINTADYIIDYTLEQISEDK
ncbi:SSU ribosomal protein S6P modification protein [Oceanobacillus limi]|uniref:SSU ribosomal protein S6P modification protein n=1 Tax=Oceanobacillus limi TaxID=930131 RepID=A0A1I0GGF4_9BACI|nr:RimK family alpha-L-glutamate ligase [Oceanobacillus limi]SET69961.1 SSU ribosomal protein S6P modification protein [Oceanobacillus limi]